MKKKYFYLLLLAALLALALCACIGREQAAQQQLLRGEYCQATYFLGDTILGRENVVPGKKLSQIPEGDYIWLDALGRAADPANANTEKKELTFYAWSAPTLLEGHIRFLPVEGSMFFPEGTLTRAEAAEIFAALLDINQTSTTERARTFSDVQEGGEHYETITRLAALGVMLGYPDGSFRPEQTITRAEFAAALCRMTGQVTPMAADGYWADSFLAAAAEQGWLTGYEDGGNGGARAITRAEAVTLVNRVRGRQPNKGAIDEACENIPMRMSRRITGRFMILWTPHTAMSLWPISSAKCRGWSRASS